jgi:hypothetical protein
MKKLLSLTLVCLGCATIPAATAPAGYPVKELKALEAQGAFAELVQHMGEVVPSERDDEWKSVTERGAAAYLDTFELKDGRHAEEPLNTAADLMKRYPHLKASKLFLAKRAEVALKAFPLTYNTSTHSHSGDSWINQVVDFAKSDATTPKLAERLAKDVVLGRLIPVTAFPLVKLATERSGKEVCSDAALHPVFLETLEEGSWAAELKTLLTTCWAELKLPVVAKLTAPGNKAFMKKACAALADKPDFSEDLKGKCPAPQN